MSATTPIGSHHERPLEAEASVWGPYPNYDDIARYEYGRMLWRSSTMRQRLLHHWLDERHPYRERFLRHRVLLEELLTSESALVDLDRRLRAQGTSLRCLVREIPPVFGSFFRPGSQCHSGSE